MTRTRKSREARNEVPEKEAPRALPEPRAEEVELASLRPHPRNYRKHPEGQIAHIMESLKVHGFYRHIVIAEDGTILAGHGLAEAARRLGLPTAPVYRLPVAATSAVALKVLTGDNELTRFAENDDRQLAELLREVHAEDPSGLLGTGYDTEAFEALVGKVGGVEAPEEFPDYSGEGALETTHKCPR